MLGFASLNRNLRNPRYAYVHLSNGASNIDKVMPEVLKLKAPKGVWSVLGNHDHRAGKNRCLHWLEKGNQNLRNRAVEIKKNGFVA